MRIGLVTNWDEKCAVAEYAKNLANHVVAHSKDVDFKIVTGTLDFDSVYQRTRDVDIIHFNYCAHAFAHMAPDGWQKFKDGPPRIFTFHESSDWWTRKLAGTGITDWLVVHDKCRDGAPMPVNVKHIPFGIPEVDLTGIEVEHKVGTFGCAFPWKGLYPLAYACGQLDMPLMALLSEPSADDCKIGWQQLRAEMESVCPKLEISTEWMPQDEVIKKLATCKVIAFPFDHCSPITGISASVRFGLAARRPLVLTRFFHFSDLFDYEYDVYFTDRGLQHTLMDAWCDYPRLPDPIVRDMSWKRSAQMYCDLYQTALVEKVVFVG